MSYTFVVCWDDEGRTPNKELVRNDVQELVAFLEQMGKHKAWKGFYRKLFTTNRLSAAIEAIKKSEGTWVILLFTKQFMAGKKVKDAEDLCACIQNNNRTIPLYYEGDKEAFKAACKSGLLHTIGLTPCTRRVAHCIENNKEWMNKVYESLKKGVYDSGKSKGTILEIEASFNDAFFGGKYVILMRLIGIGSWNTWTTNASRPSNVLPERDSEPQDPQHVPTGDSIEFEYLYDKIDDMTIISTAKAQSILHDKEHVYSTGNLPKHDRGRVLIINNIRFSDKNKYRQGAECDSDNLTYFFGRLNYKVDVKKNLTKQEIHDALEAESENPDHKTATSFVLCVMSHGEDEEIYGCDWEPTKISKIIEFFDGEHCQNLLGKPKLFLIQACRGNTDTTGIPLEQNDSATMSTQSDSENVEQTELNLRTQEMADIVVAFSTVSRFKSYRKPTSGSRFITTFIKVMCQRAHDEHLIDILTQVHNEVEKQRTNAEIEGFPHYIQLPETRYTLRRKWYFLPGYDV